MAEQNTTTLIDAVNKVLENIGERRQTALTSPVSRKANQALTDSLLDLATLHDWEFTQESIPAISWSVDTAFLGDVHRIHGVSVGDITNGYWTVPFISKREFDSYPNLPYTDLYTKPRFYTISTYNKVRFNNYPNSAETQAMVKFYVTQELVPPTLVTDKFPIPERMIPILLFRACHYMAISHLDDAQTAAQWANQYEQMVQRLRDRERSMPSTGFNMFRYRG